MNTLTHVDWIGIRTKEHLCNANGEVTHSPFKRDELLFPKGTVIKASHDEEGYPCDIHTLPNGEQIEVIYEPDYIYARRA